MGRSRRNELGIVWDELGPVEDILAAGAPPETLRTSDQTVEASAIRSGRDAVILAVKDQPHYNRYVDETEISGLTLQLPRDSQNCPALQLAWPHPENLKIEQAGGVPTVKLRPFALSVVLLWSCDQTRLQKAQEMMTAKLPDVARYALNVLADEQTKTAAVSRHLPHDLQGDPALLDEAAKLLEKARGAVHANDWATAWQQARSGLASTEEYRAEAMRAAATDADRRGEGDRARYFLNLYFSLPNYAYVTRGGAAIEPGQLRKEILEAEAVPVWPSIDRVAH